MARKGSGSVLISPQKENKKIVISMRKKELAKVYKVPGFRTGKYLSKKDRPRKKKWFADDE